MKLLLLATLLGLSLANVYETYETYEPIYQKIYDREIIDDAFKPGREYRYFYDGQVMNGIPRTSKQHSATRIQALVILQMHSPSDVTLKLTHIRIGKLNQKIWNPRAQLPFSLFHPVPLQEEHRVKLEKPLQFHYQDGMIRDIRFDSSEEPWSANIKRGVLNLLQVNVRQHGSTDASDDMKLTNSVSPNTLGQANFFRVMEKTLEGECETAYSITEQPPVFQPTRVPVLNVTKAINFERCQKRPEIKYNWRFADRCPTCDQKYTDDEKFLKSSSIIKYNITGTRQSFLIESAKAESQYSLLLYSEEGSMLNTYVNQTLFLYKSGPISTPVHRPSSPVETETKLVYSLDWDMWKEKFFMESEDTFHQRSPYSKIPNKIEMVEKLITELVRYGDGITKPVALETPRVFLRLVTILRMLTKPEVEQVFTRYYKNPSVVGVSPEEVKFIRDVLPNVLALAGTEPTISVLVKKIETREITPLRAAAALRQLPLARVVSQKTVNHVKELCRLPVIESRFTLKQACYLSLGSLINSACQPKHDRLAVEQKHTRTIRCTMPQKEEYVKFFINLFKQSPKWESKILYLKSLSNAGLDISVFPLEKIIQNTETFYPPYIRAEAILALRHIRNLMPKKVQKILMPIFMNPREPSVVRIPASYLILSSIPERPIIEMMAKQIHTDPSIQTASFVYSYLRTLANSTNPCYKKLARDTELALRFTRQITPGLPYSKYIHIPFHNVLRKFGLDLEPFMSLSNTSFIPHVLGMNLNLNDLGFFKKDLLTVAMSLHGMEPSMYQMFGPRGNYFTTPFEDILSRSPRSAPHSYKTQLKRILETLKIKSRTFPYSTEPKAWTYFRWQGQEMGFIPFSPEYITSMMQDGMFNFADVESTLRTGKNFNFHYATMLSEGQYKIPTTLGLPLVVRHRVPAVMKAVGTLKATIEPATSFKNIVLHAHISPSVAVKAVQTMEVWSPILNSGVKVQMQARVFTPIKASLEANLQTEPTEIKLNIEPPTTRRELFTAESFPVTYTRTWPTTLKTFEEPEERVIPAEEFNRIKKVHKEVPGDLLGVGFEMRARYTPINYLAPRWVPTFPVNGPNKISIFTKPGPNRPEKIQVKVEALLEKLTEEPFTPRLLKKGLFPIEEQSSEQVSSEEITPERYTSPSLRKTEFVFEVKAVGASTHQRKFKVELKQHFSPDRRLERIFGKIYRSPTPTNPKPLEVCMTGEYLFPQVPFNPEELYKKKAVNHWEFKWGPQCQSEGFVSISTVSERTAHQTYWERDNLPEYHECKAQGTQSPLECYEYLRKAGRLNKYNIQIKYSNVPPTVKNVTEKVWRALKTHYYWQSDVNRVHVPNPQNLIRATVRIDPHDTRRVNVTVKAPKENVILKDIYLPMRMRPYRMNVFHSPMDHTYRYGLMTAMPDQPRCKVSSQRVRTFDGQSYTVPLTTCYSVLAKDCSEEQRFAVLMKKISPETDEKKVKILTQTRQVILQREGDRIEIEMDGSRYTPPESPEMYKQWTYGERSIKCVKYGPYVKCLLPKEGVEVQFDGYTVLIKMSPFYLSQQCGLCGHYDNEPSYEFVTPEFEPITDVRRFFLQYTMKTSECEIPTNPDEICEDMTCPWRPTWPHLRPNPEDPETPPSSSEEETPYPYERPMPSLRHYYPETIEPKRLNRIVRKMGKTCLSKEPLPKCPDTTYPKESTTQEVPYACLPTSEFKTMEYEYAAQESPIPEVRSLPTSFTRTERIPTLCKKY